MKNNKGFAPILIIIVVLVVLAVGGIAYYAGTKNNSTPQDTSENNNQPLANQNNVTNTQKVYTISDTGKSTTNQLISEDKILKSLKVNWPSIQAFIPFRPSHPGTTMWSSPETVQFIGSSILVRFEDGYNPGIAVLSFDDNNNFKILETFKNQSDFIFSDWLALLNKYGSSSYPLSTYTMSLLRNKQIVSFQNLTNVPENVLVKNYSEN